MKCTKCGAETEGDAFCPKCKEPTDGRESQASDKEAFEPSVQAEAEPEALPQEAEPVNRSDEAGLQQQEEPAQQKVHQNLDCCDSCFGSGIHRSFGVRKADSQGPEAGGN